MPVLHLFLKPIIDTFGAFFGLENKNVKRKLFTVAVIIFRELERKV